MLWLDSRTHPWCDLCLPCPVHELLDAQVSRRLTSEVITRISVLLLPWRLAPHPGLLCVSEERAQWQPRQVGRP